MLIIVRGVKPTLGANELVVSALGAGNGDGSTMPHNSAGRTQRKQATRVVSKPVSCYALMFLDVFAGLNMLQKAVANEVSTTTCQISESDQDSGVMRGE
jgi:hypothetical protein